MLRSRRIPPLLLLPLLPLAAACGSDAPDTAAENPQVAVWRPDSPRVAAAEGGDSAALPGGAGDSVAPGEQTSAAAPGGTGGGDGGDASPGGAPAQGAAGSGSQPVQTGGGGAGQGGGTSGTPGSAPAAQAGSVTAESILLRAERAYDAVRTLRADFVQDLTVPLLNTTQRSRGEIFHRKPDRFLMRFSDPAGDVVVADGRALWLYYPSNDPGQVIRTSMGEAGRIDLQREFLSNPTERFDATLVGSEAVAGRQARVLDLVPRAAAPYRQVRIWIDEQDALARRFRITENNDAVRTVELRNLRVNETLADDLFTFTPPPNAQVFEQ